MSHRISQQYTILIARSGKEPVLLFVRPLMIALAIGLPVVLIGAIIILLAYQNVKLSQRNSQLTKDAATILERVEILESTITTLQKRAGMDDDEEAIDGGEALESSDEDGFESDVDSESFEDGYDEFDSPDENYLEEGSDSDLDSFNDYESSDPQGGLGVAVTAENLLELAKTKLPDLVKKLEGQVEPALEEIIVREDAKPKGIPLTASDTEISSWFGLRPNPFGWGYEFHQGIDFVAAYGSPIYATAPGIVEKAEWEPGFGNHVIVKHSYGYETLYGHLAEISVKAGDRLDRYQVVGSLGSTGRSSGPHLHYSVFRSGEAVDPKKYLD